MSARGFMRQPVVDTPPRKMTRMELRKSFTSYLPKEDLPTQPWVEQLSVFLTSAQVVMRAGLGWVFGLGITSDMPFYQKKNLGLINRVTFLSLLLAMPVTFLLILLGFGHPFSLLISWMLIACFVLSLNGIKQVEWSKALFAFSPAVVIFIFTMLELNTSGSDNTMLLILSRQGLCFSLLLPILVYGFEDRQKVVGVTGLCVLLFLLYEVGYLRLGAFGDNALSGFPHGLFSMLSVLQYTILASCVLYMQHFTMQQEQKSLRFNQKLQHLAMRDGMTGLFNRAFMEQLIADAINRARRSQNPLALLMIDVDYFKQINDSLGHNVGDETLKELIQLLNNNKRSTDYLGRWGGDELVMLLTETNLAGAGKFAEKLSRLVESHNFIRCKHLTISVGASQFRDEDTPPSFVGRADGAMYRAKRGGRNRIEVEKPPANTQQPPVRDQPAAENEQQLAVSYQPPAASNQPLDDQSVFTSELAEIAERYL